MGLRVANVEITRDRIGTDAMEPCHPTLQGIGRIRAVPLFPIASDEVEHRRFLGQIDPPHSMGLGVGQVDLLAIRRDRNALGTRQE